MARQHSWVNSLPVTALLTFIAISVVFWVARLDPIESGVIRRDISPSFVEKGSDLPEAIPDPGLGSSDNFTENTAIIFLHGLGDSPLGGLVDYFKHEFVRTNNTHWITPASPFQLVTAANGRSVNSWFDISELPFSQKSPKTEFEVIAPAVETIHGIIDSLVADGVKPSRIVLAGVSQGGALTLVSALTCNYTLAGAVVLWGWNPLKEDLLSSKITKEGKKTPFLWSHGLIDKLILPENAKAGSKFLSSNGVSCELHMNENQGHLPCEAENNFIGDFLSRRLYV